jgi:hypothetical protein
MVRMEYYTAVEKNEAQSFAGKWMELEISCEISQIEVRVACSLS